MAAVYFAALLGLDGDNGDETGLVVVVVVVVVVIADVICITPSASKQRKVEIHRSHFSEGGKAKD
jgi:hypothetical protein